MKILIIINDAPYGIEISTLAELTKWVVDSVKVLTF
jgi:sulfur relay (sulfurtransferase) complex TusBCD TusD component (DsrE family)